jgi:hypothetical protein
VADATQVEIPFEYTLELVRGSSKAIERAVLIPNVSRFVRRPASADRRFWPIDLSAHPIKQSSGWVEEEWTFEGHSGESERTALSIDKSARRTSRTAGGVALFEELLELLAFFESEKKRYQSAWGADPARRPRLIVRALREGWSYYCDQVVIEPQRAVGRSRFSWSYTLTLTTEGEAKDVRPLTLVNDPSRAVAVSEASLKETLAFDAKVNRERASILQSAAKASREASKAQRGIVDSPIGRLLAQIPEQMNAFRAPVEQFARQVAEISTQAARVVEAGGAWPRESAASLAHYATETLHSLARIWDEMRSPLRDRARAVLDRLRRPISEIKRSSLRLLGSAGSGMARGSAISTMTSALRVQAVRGQAARLVFLSAGETLEDLAERFLGSAERWREIRDLNGMRSGWQLADGQAVGAGTPLWVPVDGPLMQPDADMSSLYGSDFAWDFKREDFLVERPEALDLQVVSGKDNVRQALILRASTPLGRVRVFRDMGIDADIGGDMTDERAALLALQTRMQFGREDRIKEIVDTKMSRIANTVSVSLSVMLVAGEELSVSRIGIPRSE